MAPISLSSGSRTERWQTRVHSTPSWLGPCTSRHPLRVRGPFLRAGCAARGQRRNAASRPSPAALRRVAPSAEPASRPPPRLMATVDVFESMAARDSRTCSDRRPLRPQTSRRDPRPPHTAGEQIARLAAEARRIPRSQLGCVVARTRWNITYERSIENSIPIRWAILFEPSSVPPRTTSCSGLRGP